MEIISEYTEKQAIDDGVLVDISTYSKVFNRATTNLMNKGYFEEKKIKVANLLDLLAQAKEIVSKKDLDWFYSGEIEFPDGTKGKIFIAQNESNSYTLMLPEDY